jgi:hypothetical protein
MAFMRSPVRSRSGPPSFAHECRRRMPRRSVAERREGGPVLSTNELRLGKPGLVSELRLLNPRRPVRVRALPKQPTYLPQSLAETATFRISRRTLAVFCTAHAQASGLPPPSHGWRQAVRLRSEKLGSESPFLCRPHVRCDCETGRPQCGALPPHGIPTTVASSRCYRVLR